MNFPLLKKLCEAHGVPGQEDNIREIVREELKGICEFETDYLGNLHCIKRANLDRSPSDEKKLMIAAHMDEIGFAVKFIDSNGFIRIHPLGGWDPRQMCAQRVFVHTKEGPKQGLLMLGTKPKHLLAPGEGDKAPTTDQFFVDLGMTADEVKAAVSIGDGVTMDRDCRMNGNFVTGKAMDNRVACYVMIEAMKAVGGHKVDVYGVATVQEEIGCRGAMAAGISIKPDVCVAIDVTLANDLPGIPEQDCITKLGEGTAIKILDSSLICHPKVVAHFRELAEKNEIKYQLELLPAGGTDASAVQKQNGGVPSFTLSVPCRYVHTVNETISPADLDASVALLAKYIENMHFGEYSYR